MRAQTNEFWVNQFFSIKKIGKQEIYFLDCIKMNGFLLVLLAGAEQKNKNANK